MFKKQGYSASPITKLSNEAVLADPIIVDRMTKLASEIKAIAPKSDDFLYFSIIFLKSAESALLDETGSLKKVGNERAWGYFDENWRWHGNVKPHKNNNGDIFPELELKKAASKWIGMPLCKDHESSSVDGIRGIILDTHYDEKLKQVVGLCALDRINYADLARKVETGVVRYGSMGTAVELSVCSECQNFAKTANEYCNHVKSRTAWGEINVGLKPIEYSLVVQPAEPGAVLLRCIASLQDYKKEFVNYGVEDFDQMLGRLSLSQAQHLNTIVKTACGEDGCSPSERRKIITSFLKKNNLIDAISHDVSENQRVTSDSTFGSEPERFVLKDSDDATTWSSIGGNTGVIGTATVNDNVGNVFLNDSVIDKNIPDVKIINASSNKNKSLISEIMEDIMTESQLRKRAELRRKLAYHQGGADGVEPSGFKSKPFSHNEDKHMKQTKSMGSKESLFPGDESVKEKLSRADLDERQMRRLAYFQGGSEKAVEPAGFKSKPFPHTQDKHMNQTKSMGSKDGLFPGDEKVKEVQKRAAYAGPALSTKLSWPSLAGNGLNKSAALFEVYAGDRKVIAATGHEIFGDEIEENWDWFTSRAYGQEVCKQIRASGIDHVAGLLKGAQAVEPTMPVPPAPVAMPEPEPEATAEAAPESEESDSKDDMSPKDAVSDALAKIEIELDKAKQALSKMTGDEVNVNVNVGDDKKDGDSLKLAKSLASNLKVVVAELDEAADELAMIAETYDGESRLSPENRRELHAIASQSLAEANSLLGQSRAVTKIASEFASEFTKVASTSYMEHDAYDDTSYAEDDSDAAEDNVHAHMADDGDDSVDMAEDFAMEGDEADDDVNDLIAKAMDLRRIRRESLVVEAAKKQKAKSTSKKEDSKKEDSKSAKKEVSKKKADEEEEDAKSSSGKKGDKMSKAASLRDMVSEAFTTKKAEDEKETYKVRLRRAYDVAMDMQNKGLIAMTKTALDKQVDDIMEFDDRAFEAFKRSVANARPVESIKIAKDLGGLNVGVTTSEQSSAPVKSTAELLSMLWE